MVAEWKPLLIFRILSTKWQLTYLTLHDLWHAGLSGKYRGRKYLAGNTVRRSNHSSHASVTVAESDCNLSKAFVIGCSCSSMCLTSVKKAHVVDDIGYSSFNQFLILGQDKEHEGAVSYVSVKALELTVPSCITWELGLDRSFNAVKDPGIW